MVAEAERWKGDCLSFSFVMRDFACKFLLCFKFWAAEFVMILHIDAFWHGSGYLGGTRHLYCTVVNLIRLDPTRAQAPGGVRQ